MPASYSQEILDKYPQPLAATYARFIDEREVAAQHTLLLASFEVLLKYLAAAAATQYLSLDDEHPALNAALGSLRRPSLGHWSALLRAGMSWWSQQRRADQEFVLPELPQLYSRPTQLPASVLLLHRLQGSGSSKASLRQLFDALVA